jgi:hypothetical protein
MEGFEEVVSRREFNAFCDTQYPPDAAMKTMRRDRLSKIADFLKGGKPPIGSWRYRIQDKGYTLVNFPTLGLSEILCLKGTQTEASGSCKELHFGLLTSFLSGFQFGIHSTEIVIPV